ncbi:hypothetical protein MCEMSEM18_03579 [Comamonadaceae bacterium]
MNRTEYLLIQAGSECNEIAHRAGHMEGASWLLHPL